MNEKERFEEIVRAFNMHKGKDILVEREIIEFLIEQAKWSETFYQDLVEMKTKKEELEEEVNRLQTELMMLR